MAANDFANAFGDIGTSITDFGSAAADLLEAQGATTSAGTYMQAASVSEQNAAVEAQSTAIQEVQAQRKLYSTVGGQQAEVAGAGFGASGTALDLMRSSAEQGALTQQVTQLQGSLNVSAYQQQAAAETGQAQSAETAASAETSAAGYAQASGVVSGIEGVASFIGGLFGL